MRQLATILPLLLAAACVLQEEQPPPLSGPAEFGRSVQVSASPDMLPTDGVSASLITITARDSAGSPERGLPLRGEVMTNGVVVDLGRLTPGTVVTNGAGQAHLTFTAPLVAGSSDTGTVIEIAVTPLGDNYAAAVRRAASIRLVPVR